MMKIAGKITEMWIITKYVRRSTIWKMKRIIQRCLDADSGHFHHFLLYRSIFHNGRHVCCKFRYNRFNVFKVITKNLCSNWDEMPAFLTESMDWNRTFLYKNSLLHCVLSPFEIVTYSFRTPCITVHIIYQIAINLKEKNAF